MRGLLWWPLARIFVLSMQGAWIQSLLRQLDSICHNYELIRHNSRFCVLQRRLQTLRAATKSRCGQRNQAKSINQSANIFLKSHMVHTHTHTHTQVGDSFFKERYAKMAKFPNPHGEKKTLVGHQTFKRKKKKGVSNI